MYIKEFFLFEGPGSCRKYTYFSEVGMLEFHFILPEAMSHAAEWRWKPREGKQVASKFHSQKELRVNLNPSDL